jgi:hypothetical protein
LSRWAFRLGHPPEEVLVLPGDRAGRLALLSLLLAMAAMVPLPGTARATYQASADTNESAFRPPCVGFQDSHPARMLALALIGLRSLGYATTVATGTRFSHAAVLARTVGDFSFYVHSHGDNYWYAPAQRRYNGFREDSGDCSQAVIFSNQIAAARAGRFTNLVVVSTCHNADPGTTLPGAFGIGRTKDQSGGSHFYLGYLGIAYDNDEQAFETAFWSALERGRSVGAAFDIGSLQAFSHGLEADWWGTYTWSGKAGAAVVCPRCLAAGAQ